MKTPLISFSTFGNSWCETLNPQKNTKHALPALVNWTFLVLTQNNIHAAIGDNGRHNFNDDNTAMHHHKSCKTLSSQKARRETNTNNVGDLSGGGKHSQTLTTTVFTGHEGGSQVLVGYLSHSWYRRLVRLLPGWQNYPWPCPQPLWNYYEMETVAGIPRRPRVSQLSPNSTEEINQDSQECCSRSWCRRGLVKLSILGFRNYPYRCHHDVNM